MRLRVPSTGSTSPFGEVDCLDDDVRAPSAVRAPSSHVPDARPVRVVGDPVVLSPETRSSAVTLFGLPREIPRTSFCSRLVVTSILRNTPFPSLRLSPPGPPRLFSPSGSSGDSVLGGALNPGSAGRPSLVVPALDSPAVGAASASCYRIVPPTGMEGVPSKRPCRALSTLHSPPDSNRWRPMSPPASVLSILSTSASARICFHGLHQEHASANPRRLPPTGPIVVSSSHRTATA